MSCHLVHYITPTESNRKMILLNTLISQLQITICSHLITIFWKHIYLTILKKNSTCREELGFEFLVFVPKSCQLSLILSQPWLKSYWKQKHSCFFFFFFFQMVSKNTLLHLFLKENFKMVKKKKTGCISCSFFLFSFLS